MNDKLFCKIKNDGEVLGISPLYAAAAHIIVGFSGGADSSFLLEYLLRLKGEGNFPEVSAIHVNHMLRGVESDGDEEFCRERCRELGVPLTVCRADVPRAMRETGKGAEECARDARYAAFEDEARRFGEGTLIATAHNADDNLETVLFNLARGGGASGLSGIPPVRGNIIRPILGVTSREIRAACDESGIPYVIDSTNAETEYTRNFIRHSVAPLMREINPAVANAALRLGVSLREDSDYIKKIAADAVGKYLPEGEADFAVVPRSVMASLPAPVLARAVIMLIASVTTLAPSAEQIRLCRELIVRSGTGMVSLRGAVTLEVARDTVSVYRPREVGEFMIPVELPEVGECTRTVADEAGFELYLSRDAALLPENDENIYKLSIHSTLRFDTIYGRVYARSRRAGDTLSLGGHTRRLKKMLSERGIPRGRRDALPVIEDECGVLLVPSLPERGDAYARPEDYAAGNVLHVLYVALR